MNAYEISSNDKAHSTFEQQSKRYMLIGEGLALVVDL